MRHIVIIGAGTAGCIAAMALAPNHKITLIDRRGEAAERIGENLPPASRRILKQLDLLQEFASQEHLPSQGMRSYWACDQVQYTDDIRNPDGFGWFLDRRKFENFLRSKVAARGVDCCWPARLKSAREVDSRWHIVTDTGRHLEADFVIDAGGRPAPFLRGLGIRREAVDRLVSCWITLPDRGENRMGTIAATETGWFYSAPLPHHRRVISFQTDADLIGTGTIEPGIKKNLNSFLIHAQACRPMADILKETDVTQATHHGITAANSTRSPKVASANWAALGDAATSFDPLSSQGLFNAMAGAMQLAALINSGHPVEGEYRDQVDNIWRHYLHHRHIFYSLEKRWPDAPFWRRRIAPVSPSVSLPIAPPFAAAPDPRPGT